MNNPGTESGNLKQDSAVSDGIRKSFRVPTDDNEDIWVVIDNKKYPVTDICPDGIGIVFRDDPGFTVEQILNNCNLKISNVMIQNLNGRIVHLSSESGRNFHWGIQWVGLEEKTASHLSKIVGKMKTQLLKDNIIGSVDGTDREQ